ncbi:MAG: alpha/beta hydrolase [candidate division Zixibacteria bacterium]|nr:alpha/beta hydrolase [candidate division Zixibacteria bacterium]
MRYRLLLTGVFLAFSLAVSHGDDGQTARASKIQFTMPDGLVQTAWFLPSPAAGEPPLLVLLHMMGHDHGSYDPFIESLQNYVKSDSARQCLMPHILNFDLRGHGESVRAGDREIPYHKMADSDFVRIPEDIRLTVAYLLADTGYGINAGGIMIIGASIGANSAILTSELLPNVRKVAMLSPGEDYRGLRPASAMKNFHRDMLICVARMDDYSRTSSESLMLLDPKNCRLRVYEGGEHGTDIINNNPRAMQDLLTWLCE